MRVKPKTHLAASTMATGAATKAAAGGIAGIDAVFAVNTVVSAGQHPAAISNQDIGGKFR
jgi:hypothetical protein